MEERSSGTSERSWPEGDFTDLLLAWSVREIFDENLYKHKVEKIPESFESVDQYLLSYAYPLLEETRAALAASLEAVCKAPFARVRSLKMKPDTLLYNVEVDCGRNKTSNHPKVPYRAMPGDLVLLSYSEPENVSDPKHIGWMCTFASVTGIYDNEKGGNFTSFGFTLKTACNIEVYDQQSKPLYVVYLMNMTTHTRIWNALRKRQNLKIMEKILVKSGPGEENCDFCPQTSHSEFEEKFRSTSLSKLNESQLGAVRACIRNIKCSHQSTVELIWGPPGTGKTSTLSSLLYVVLGMNVRTLICAPTNTAIRELASRVTALVRNSHKTESGKSFLTCPLGDMLIFGNKDRLNVGSDIQEIFLDYRVDRLTEFSVPATGWRHCVSSMVEFLENCVSQHLIFVEKEQIKSKEHADGETSKSGYKSFLEFARDQFTHLASPLRSFMLTVINYLPRSFIDEKNYQNIVECFSLLDCLEEMFFEDSGMTSKDLETVFLQQIITGSESSLDKTSLRYIRSRCLVILRSLHASLRFPTVTGKPSIADLCSQKASLIFCTISSAYKLYSVDVEPFQLLVIDEAAQVKECETAIAFQIKYVRRAILVGDELQLPATVTSKLSEEAGFGRSLFERLSSMGRPKHLLNVQYRMHPAISRFPNSKFYQNQISDGPNVQRKSYEISYLPGKMFGPYSFINVHGGTEELDDVSVSRKNMVEVAAAVKLVQKLFKAWDGSKLSIGLISPYTAQVAAIQDKLQSTYENLEGFTVKVKSVDGFQGGEEDIIIISTVRSHKGGSIGFLSSPQRTNVALTRARHCLWILGNATTLSESGSVWEAIVSDAKDRQCLFDADEDCHIIKATIDVGQKLDDLLSAMSPLFEDIRWEVVYSDNFKKSFDKLGVSKVKKSVLRLLLNLAQGIWPKKIDVNWKCQKSSYVVKQFKVEKYYVVCSIDIRKGSVYYQVLNVWNILPVTDTTKLLNQLDNIYSMYTDDYINHCNDKLLERNLEVPRSWPLSSDIFRNKNRSTTKLTSGGSASSAECRTYGENSEVSESSPLIKFYPLLPVTVKHFLSNVEDGEVGLPFEVINKEREIIEFPRSSFILGRSGTGKTTILTKKLCLKRQQYCIATQDSVAADKSECITDEIDVEQCSGESKDPVLHQLFVTMSPKLCHAVKRNVAQMIRSSSHSVISSSSMATENFYGHNNFTGLDDVDEVSESEDMPDTFVGIQQEKYPLIITFHKFLMMLDGTLGKSYFQRFPYVRDSSHYEGRRSVALQTFLRKNEVTYDRFASMYWPHFNAKLTKSLDASRVFTEIMSHIKGGPLEGEAHDYKKIRKDYISLSESRVSTLSEDQRDAIYDIFENYEKIKLKRGEFDLADFVSDLHQRLNKEDLLGDKMDFVYIDEVQDLTMAQISLFRYICKNVDEGFVFSGDTAQTIARGVDFRFEDIKSLFYSQFLMRPRNSDFSSTKEKGLIADKFILSHNFRTHTGVLGLAQSVVDLICYYFPHFIDKLDRETSNIHGEPPVFLEPESSENSIISIFGHSGKNNGKWVGFGADQVILVRDDSARKEISSYIGHQALILTIVECKGLEFQDVLLYNFFGSSPLGNQWRVVYEFLSKKGLFDVDSPEPFPNFSPSKHNILCSELKQLYVAITRTRQRLWICENNVEVSKPMLYYWRKLSLVQVRKIDDFFAEAMQRDTSTPEEWKSQGIKLFWEKNYEMATLCFKKAGEETWERRANASRLRAAADSLCGSKPEGADIMLREAAEIFESIGRVESAAECFYELGEYTRAGRIYLDKCGTSELVKAAECFSLAGKLEDSETTKSLGDTLLEIYLLEKAGQSEKSCLLILSYVISNALWGSGNKGWPLKSFPLKVELLNRAMSAADMVSETFHASICAQAKFLLYEQKNLSELMQFYNASKQYESPVVEILILRKLLDAHFEVDANQYEWDRDLHLDPSSFDQRLVRNQASVGALVYLWNLWKVRSLEILQCLDSLDLDEFCQSYFGLMRLPGAETFHLMNPDAVWARDVNRNVVAEDHHFASAARKFWLQDLVSVGDGVLNALQRLHKSSVEKCLPLYCQCMCLLHIFDIAKFFIDSKSSINLEYADESELQNFVHLSIKCLELFFPLDPSMTLSENMISLRGTEISKKLLEESIFRCVDGRKELSYKQIGQVVMTMLGTGKLEHCLYDMIAQRLSTDSPWIPFIDMSCDSPLGCYPKALRQGLYTALTQTHDLGLGQVRDCISPNCFLYVMDRLLHLIPKVGGNFFTMKSSILEYCMCLPSDSDLKTNFLITNLTLRGELSVFVSRVIVQCLSSDTVTRRWIENSDMNDSNSYLRVLVLRMMMIVCVMELNGEFPKNMLAQMLGKRNITSHLPNDFCEALKSKNLSSHSSAISAIASAFKIVGDPLVLVISTDDVLQLSSPDVFVVGLKSFSCKADILNTLFPQSIEASKGQPGESSKKKKKHKKGKGGRKK